MSAVETEVRVVVLAGRQAFAGGQRHGPGETFACSPEVAELLVLHGHVEPARLNPTSAHDVHRG